MKKNIFATLLSNDLSAFLRSMVFVLAAIGWSAVDAQIFSAGLGPIRSEYEAIPLFSAEKDDAAVMLSLTNDHQLFIKAYNDYADIFGVDGVSGMVDPGVQDGVPDIEFNRLFPYEGYFDANRCYTYGSYDGPGTEKDTNLFIPVSVKRIDADASNILSSDIGYCNPASGGNQWSGRFLNWLTMTRIDIVRYALYGGYRWNDKSDSTILERAYLPNDAHSFVKFYGKSDINRLADVSALRTQSSSCANGNCDEGYSFCNTTKFEPVADLLKPGQSLKDWIDPSVSSEIERYSQDVESPPLLRAVKGNFRFWATSERYQCLYGRNNKGDLSLNSLDGEIQYFPSSRLAGQNGNDPAVTLVNAYTDSPRDISAGRDYVVRVQVCDELDPGYTHECRLYENGTGLSRAQSLKPIGSLHKATREEGNFTFGLITGGYLNNKTGGVLRKNLDAIDSEINDDGTFIKNGTESLIGSLDALRIVDYRLYVDNGNTRNNEKGSYRTRCIDDQDSRAPDGLCKNWGNPLGEILLQTYNYLAGYDTQPNTVPVYTGTNTTVLRPLASDNTLQSRGLTSPRFSDKIGADVDRFSCSDLNVYAFSGSVSSFDGEAQNSLLRSVNDRNTDTTQSDLPVSTWAADIDAAETSALQYFLSTANSNVCEINTISSFFGLNGLGGVCPEAPSLGGDYSIAAASYKVNKDGVRTDIEDGRIRTTGISLAGATPVMNMVVGGQDVRLIPTCLSAANDIDNASEIHACSLVDFQVFESTSTKRRYFLSYEDREYGNDYDSDLNMMVDLELVNGSIQVTRTLFGASTGNDFLLGFAVSGTTDTAANKTPTDMRFKDGSLCQTENVKFSLRGGGLCITRGSFTPAPTINGDPIQELPSPLYFAAKWGWLNGFDEAGDPVLAAGLIDGPRYLNIQNPATFREGVDKLLTEITLGARAGTGAAPAVNTLGGNGFVLQSLYLPEYKDDDDNLVNWVGVLNGLYFDGSQYRLESGKDTTVIDDDDDVVVFEANDKGELEFRTAAFSGANPLVFSSSKPLNELDPVWSAHGQLAAMSDAAVITQRATYTALADTGRFIFSALDTPDGNGDYDGQITSAEATNVDFDRASVDDFVDLLDVGIFRGTTRFSFSSALEKARAGDLIDYIRGKDFTDFRSRSVKWGPNNQLGTWRLGDIVNSTPLIVGAPSEDYARVYGDADYQTYLDNFSGRRQVAYVGANDGMFHAFNMGFVNDGKFELVSPDDNTAHPLGSELWSYVPYNLLPHLKWLAEKDYGDGHVFYVDSSAQSFDVNIFDKTDPETKGWGTILVVGMRLGGGSYLVDTGRELKPSYMVFDVTRPGEKPILLAEFIVDDLGHTLGQVEVAKFRSLDMSGEADSSGRNDWYLVFGSGPQGSNAYKDAVSDKPPKLFAVDLTRIASGNPIQPKELDLQSEYSDSGLIGGIRAADWDLDYFDDALYFGVMGDDVFDATSVSPPANRGALMQVQLDPARAALMHSPEFLLLDANGNPVNREFVNAPEVRNDSFGNRWVYASSGRYFSEADISRSDYENGIFGVKLNSASGQVFKPVRQTNMFDASSVDVFFNSPPEGFDVESRSAEVRLRKTGRTSGSRLEAPNVVLENADGDDVDITTVEDLQLFITGDPNNRGWYRSLDIDGELAATRPAFFGNSARYNTFLPESSTSCTSVGNSFGYTIDLITGLPQTQLLFPTVSSDGAVTSDSGESLQKAASNTGPMKGFASQPMVMDNILVSAMSSGEVETENVSLILDNISRRAWREIPSEYIE